jgi:tetratricopeptide (TPR) repeat protein
MPAVGFNVAVSPFRELTADGRVTPSPTGDALASALFDQLDTELAQIKTTTGIPINRRSPEETEPVEGVTREQRASAASRVAQRLNADVVVYGVLDSAASGRRFVPEFYLSERSLAKAEELAGQHELGAGVGTKGDVANLVVPKLVGDRVLGRMRAMTQFVIGLGYYALDGHYGEALAHFQAAATVEGWNDADGKEVVYLLLGNAAQKTGDLDRAEAAYQRAVAINPEYARGRLGVAETLFQRAKGTCEAGDADSGGLQRAVGAFRGALDAQVQPALSDVELKADLGLGRVYVCLSQALHADLWDEAAQAFARVIAAYEGGNQRVRQLAAEAYAGMGLVELPSADATDAAEGFRRSALAYRKAIEASRELDRTAAFYAMLGYVLDRLGQRAESDAAYAEAIRLEPDPALREQYQNARSEAQRRS